MVGEDDTSVLVDEKGLRDGRYPEFLSHAGLPVARVEEHKKVVPALIQVVENALGLSLDIDANHLEAAPTILLVQPLDLGHGAAAWAAPCSPKIDQNRASAKIVERHGPTVTIFE